MVLVSFGPALETQHQTHAMTKEMLDTVDHQRPLNCTNDNAIPAKEQNFGSVIQKDAHST
jgi:hypothetical protein